MPAAISGVWVPVAAKWEIRNLASKARLWAATMRSARRVWSAGARGCGDHFAGDAVDAGGADVAFGAQEAVPASCHVAGGVDVDDGDFHDLCDGWVEAGGLDVDDCVTVHQPIFEGGHGSVEKARLN
jgi:hypothetical protein